MVGYDDCPYCNKETEIEFEEYANNENFEVTCEHCKKKFIVYFDFDLVPSFYISKKEGVQNDK